MGPARRGLYRLSDTARHALTPLVLAAVALGPGAASSPARTSDGAVWTPATLPAAQVGKSYSVAIKVSTGLDPLGSQQGPPACGNDGSVVKEAPIYDDCGKLPPGLQVVRPAGNGDTATIQGTPAGGSRTYTFRLLDTWLDQTGKLAYSVHTYSIAVTASAPSTTAAKSCQAGELCVGSRTANLFICLRDADCEGGGGADTFTCSGLATTCDGGAGDDHMTCTTGSRCDGGAGNDVLTCSGSGTICIGGSGSDLFTCTNHVICNALDGAGGDVVQCGAGNPKVLVDPGDTTKNCTNVVEPTGRYDLYVNAEPQKIVERTEGEARGTTFTLLWFRIGNNKRCGSRPCETSPPVKAGFALEWRGPAAFRVAISGQLTFYCNGMHQTFPAAPGHPEVFQLDVPPFRPGGSKIMCMLQFSGKSFPQSGGDVSMRLDVDAGPDDLDPTNNGAAGRLAVVGG